MQDLRLGSNWNWFNYYVVGVLCKCVYWN